MTSKRIFVTIVCAIVITISYIKLLSLAANNFIVEGNDIVFDFRSLNVQFHYILFYMLTLLPWKIVLWERDWFDIFLMQGMYFPFFMMFLMGWFTLDIPTDNFIATLSMFTGFMVAWTFSFVLLCVVAEVPGKVFSVAPEKKKKPNKDEAMLLGFAAAAYMIANKLENEDKAKRHDG